MSYYLHPTNFYFFTIYLNAFDILFSIISLANILAERMKR